MLLHFSLKKGFVFVNSSLHLKIQIALFQVFVHLMIKIAEVLTQNFCLQSLRGVIHESRFKSIQQVT